MKARDYDRVKRLIAIWEEAEIETCTHRENNGNNEEEDTYLSLGAWLDMCFTEEYEGHSDESLHALCRENRPNNGNNGNNGNNRGGKNKP